jgi:glycine dehydrogenase subunit 1
MPFIPHTDAEVREMLAAIGARTMDDLFDEIPPALRDRKLDGVPGGATEAEVARLMSERARQDGRYVNFLGAGAYEHHIPAAVWELATRGEFYTAYTPYQAEASQGTLQVIYEFQSMMTSLTGLDVSNASLYDGASALAEAVLTAVRAHKKSRRILMPRTVNPVYRRVVRTIVRHQGIELVDVPYDAREGIVQPQALREYAGGAAAALVIPQPNFFGALEESDALTDWAHAQGMLAIALVNPVALALLAPPGGWGVKGADIAVGEAQPLGIPLSSGGPYIGFMCVKQELVRQMPGRIVGRTVDADGRPGFTLTLQAREQHIRRAKATSNICTNQGLMATAATIHMALLGPEGLRRVAEQCHANTRKLVAALTAIPGCARVFDRPVFHEAVLRWSEAPASVLRALEAQGIVGGLDLSAEYPELANCVLACATEQRSVAEIEAYALHLSRILTRRRLDPPCAVKANTNV